MQQNDKNPNVVVQELTQVLRDFYNEQVMPYAQANGLDPVELFDRAVHGAAEQVQKSDAQTDA